VNVESVSGTGIERRDHEGRALLDEAEVAEEPLVED
jgi:hypothetical protein